MPSQRVHSARRTVCVAAPAHVVYGMLADAPRWPVLLPSYVHVERMDFDGAGETLLAWEFEDGRVRSSRLRRTLRPREHCVDFEQDDPAWPGGTVAGSWSVEPDGAGRSLVTLRQQTPNAPAGTSAGPDGLDADAAGRLARLREAAERWDRLDELLLAFEERIRVEGPAELVYDFLYRVEDWPETLPPHRRQQCARGPAGHAGRGVRHGRGRGRSRGRPRRRDGRLRRRGGRLRRRGGRLRRGDGRLRRGGGRLRRGGGRLRDRTAVLPARRADRLQGDGPARADHRAQR
ncbi:SRPBCC family protein [Streptomyces albogriseolus]